MRLSSADFWSLSFPEWRAAVRGYRESIGQGDGAGSIDDAMSRAEFEALAAEHPDG